MSELYPSLEPEELLGPKGGGFLRPYWERAAARDFRGRQRNAP